MKKILYLLFAVCCLIAVSSCNTDGDDWDDLFAAIRVEVVDLENQPLSERTVYLYKDEEISPSTPLSHAIMKRVTDTDGIAVFYLNLRRLNIEENHSILRFCVFYTVDGVTAVADAEAVTVKRDDEFTITLIMPE